MPTLPHPLENVIRKANYLPPSIIALSSLLIQLRTWKMTNTVHHQSAILAEFHLTQAIVSFIGLSEMYIALNSPLQPNTSITNGSIYQLNSNNISPLHANQHQQCLALFLHPSTLQKVRNITSDLKSNIPSTTTKPQQHTQSTTNANDTSNKSTKRSKSIRHHRKNLSVSSFDFSTVMSHLLPRRSSSTATAPLLPSKNKNSPLLNTSGNKRVDMLVNKLTDLNLDIYNEFFFDLLQYRHDTNPDYKVGSRRHPSVWPMLETCGSNVMNANTWELIIAALKLNNAFSSIKLINPTLSHYFTYFTTYSSPPKRLHSVNFDEVPDFLRLPHQHAEIIDLWWNHNQFGPLQSFSTLSKALSDYLRGDSAARDLWLRFVNGITPKDSNTGSASVWHNLDFGTSLDIRQPLTPGDLASMLPTDTQYGSGIGDWIVWRLLGWLYLALETENALYALRKQLPISEHVRPIALIQSAMNQMRAKYGYTRDLHTRLAVLCLKLMHRPYPLFAQRFHQVTHFLNATHNTILDLLSKPFLDADSSTWRRLNESVCKALRSWQANHAITLPPEFVRGDTVPPPPPSDVAPMLTRVSKHATPLAGRFLINPVTMVKDTSSTLSSEVYRWMGLAVTTTPIAPAPSLILGVQLLDSLARVLAACPAHPTLQIIFGVTIAHGYWSIVTEVSTLLMDRDADLPQSDVVAQWNPKDRIQLVSGIVSAIWMLGSAGIYLRCWGTSGPIQLIKVGSTTVKLPLAEMVVITITEPLASPDQSGVALFSRTLLQNNATPILTSLTDDIDGIARETNRADQFFIKVSERLAQALDEITMEEQVISQSLSRMSVVEFVNESQFSPPTELPSPPKNKSVLSPASSVNERKVSVTPSPVPNITPQITKATTPVSMYQESTQSGPNGPLPTSNSREPSRTSSPIAPASLKFLRKKSISSISVTPSSSPKQKYSTTIIHRRNTIGSASSSSGSSPSPTVPRHQLAELKSLAAAFPPPSISKPVHNKSIPQPVTDTWQRALAFYRFGQGDLAAAFNLFAEVGHAVPAALFYQAEILYYGSKTSGLRQDTEQASIYYSQARNMGCAIAAVGLGDCVYFGFSGPSNVTRARTFYEIALAVDRSSDLKSIDPHRHPLVTGRILARAWAGLGDCFYAKDRHSALESYQIAVALDPGPGGLPLPGLNLADLGFDESGLIASHQKESQVLGLGPGCRKAYARLAELVLAGVQDLKPESSLDREQNLMAAKEFLKRARGCRREVLAKCTYLRTIGDPHGADEYMGEYLWRHPLDF